MKLRLSLQAAAEIEQILSALRTVSSRNASQLSTRFDSAFSMISDFPLAGRATTRGGIRCVGTRPYPYLIFYRVIATESIVEIAAVRHGARDPASMPAKPRKPK